MLGLNGTQRYNTLGLIPRLGGKAASGLERILCGVLVKRTPGNHG